MATHFTCPHCGQRTTTDRDDVEYVDFDNGTSDGVFPMLPPGQERHIDQRLCCPDCYDRADDRGRDETGKRAGLHRYDPAYHEAQRTEVPAGTSRSAIGFPPDRRMR